MLIIRIYFAAYRVGHYAGITDVTTNLIFLLFITEQQLIVLLDIVQICLEQILGIRIQLQHFTGSKYFSSLKYRPDL
ncbi:hypothetical protein AR543_10050 [Paenibacillus bovis]|uniref:Uncharacterized protein n=1 Tax=Paenibacillus bovis TaxID=1616788 RepID=A0A172ZFJ6_9BACL|nr:hypothetical protein AR543_10050 [Paenibacillus bovis]